MPTKSKETPKLIFMRSLLKHVGIQIRLRREANHMNLEALSRKMWVRSTKLEIIERGELNIRFTNRVRIA